MRNDEIVTKDLTRFGYRERKMMIELLEAYNEGRITHEAEQAMGDEVEVFMNMNSGYVFMVDEDYNTFMLNDEDLLDIFLSCPNCGAEGFPDELWDNPECDECREYAKQYIDFSNGTRDPDDANDGKTPAEIFVDEILREMKEEKEKRERTEKSAEAIWFDDMTKDLQEEP